MSKSLKLMSRQRRARKILNKILAEGKGISVQEYVKNRKIKLKKVNDYFDQHPRLIKNHVTKSNVMLEVVIGGKKFCEHPFSI